MAEQASDLRIVQKRLSQAAMDLEESGRSRIMYGMLAVCASLIFLYGVPEMYVPPGDPLWRPLLPAPQLNLWGQSAVMFAPILSLMGMQNDAELADNARRTARSLSPEGGSKQARRLADACENDVRRNRRMIRFFMGLLLFGLAATWAARVIVLRTIIGA